LHKENKKNNNKRNIRKKKWGTNKIIQFKKKEKKNYRSKILKKMNNKWKSKKMNNKLKRIKK
jgi:hypothetical protein